MATSSEPERRILWELALESEFRDQGYRRQVTMTQVGWLVWPPKGLPPIMLTMAAGLEGVEPNAFAPVFVEGPNNDGSL